ncbi:MAG: bifunctional precorrin-2 dehydrogenase/sirohydrochlorin ferrochelatase [Desulfomonilaceae bacterium]|nr:bifunctional precorrin-2 dehydrogenase/sirohydrochlorin ferrochelatase [Desulfomonilaceae bacterium]
MKPYPVMMNLDGKAVIVVGGGRVALRKIKSLLAGGARVIVISPELETELEELAAGDRVVWITEPFREELLDGYPDALLIFGTTDRREVNTAIHDAAVKRRIPCNIADVPDLCTFIVPAVITRGDLMIAVSTGGSSPALARRIREDLQKQYGPEYAAMTQLLGDLRKRILQMGNTSDENKKLFLDLVDSEILTALRRKDRDQALAILQAILPQEVDAENAIEETRMM